MAKTLESAKRKWEEKTGGKGAKWKENATAGSSQYAAGVAKFLGESPSAAVVQRQRDGINRVSAEDFNASVSGKGEKWARNYRRGMTGK